MQKAKYKVIFIIFGYWQVSNTMKMTKLLHSGMISPRNLLLQWVVLFRCQSTTLPALSAELPISVIPSIAKPGLTITVTGAGFLPGVWGGGTYIKRSTDTPGYAVVLFRVLMLILLARVSRSTIVNTFSRSRIYRPWVHQ
jgi:hypothetical protein